MLNLPSFDRFQRPLSLVMLAALAAAANAQPAQWEACTALADTERLACFDRWAGSQRSPAPSVTAPATPQVPSQPAQVSPQQAERGAADAARTAIAASRNGVLRLTRKQGCRQPELTVLSAAWELEDASDCGTFGLRAYRPTTVSFATSDTVNLQPTSGNPVNNAADTQPYRIHEMRLQLSVRTKVATGLLPTRDPGMSDSLWFGYTQLSYWQLFTPSLSRPFRSTDHEPEMVYVYPLQSANRDRWRIRYAGVGLSHQSNGQSLPLSRSWNRSYLMVGAERGDLSVQARLWRRLPEDGSKDDNPGIGDTVGRAEVALGWQAGAAGELRVTARHSLQRAARGSWRGEWFHTLAGAEGAGLQLHTQLFSGYGDSLLDFNRRRTMFSIGLSLADW